MTQQKKVKNEANETKDQKFVRIATHRAKNLAYHYRLLTRLATGSNYEITEKNAQKLIEFVNKVHDTFLSAYTPIADGAGQSKENQPETEESIF